MGLSLNTKDEAFASLFYILFDAHPTAALVTPDGAENVSHSLHDSVQTLQKPPSSTAPESFDGLGQHDSIIMG
ncbi:hypothetical protein Hypma_004235 [Hypsizygus marmoreus]|uniref:Uncharacterized protein n=1 Tax=Hypsizygus marmoreus TaxID=39966 RepID=A0A369J6V7_HYPMA|nr:hypothetical protein Hypma_004235 [Hypsizygus marmoreus]